MSLVNGKWSVILMLTSVLILSRLYALTDLAPATTYQLSFWANYMHLKGDEAKADKYFNALLVSDKSASLSYGYLYYLRDTERYEKIIELEPQLQKKFPDDPDIALMIAKALEATHQRKKAYLYLMKASKKFKENQELTYYAALAYHEMGESQQAIKIVNDFLSLGISTAPYVFHFLLSQFYLENDDTEKAFAQVKKSLDLYPQFDKGWLFLGLLYQHMGKIQQAIDGYGRFLELVGQDVLVELQLAQLIMSKERNNDPYISSEEAFSRYYYQQALAYYKQKNFTEALKAIERSLKNDTEALNSLLLKIDILGSLERYHEIVVFLAKQLQNKAQEQLWLHVAHLLATAHPESEELLNLMVKNAQKKAGDIQAVLFAADVALRANHKRHARTFLRKSYELTNDVKLKAKICFQLAMLHYQSNAYKKMKNLLSKALEHDAQFAPAHNLLAYYYATKGDNPSRAQEYAQKALKLDPDNHHYKDTQAWIYYKTKDYQKAEKLLAEIAHADDALIALHRAKLSHKLGKNAQAKEDIYRALQLSETDSHKACCTKWINRWQL